MFLALEDVAVPPRTTPWYRRLAWLRHLPLPVILVVFLVIGFRLLPGYRGQMNPDGVSYLTIARQYLAGHFGDAVNAYWSPLYSWLLVPLLAMGVEPTLAPKVLAILIGAGMIATTWWLLRNLRVPLDARVIAAVTLFPILYYFGMDVTTPDLLISAALLLYLAQMTSPRYGRRWFDGVASGALGGLAYLAKAYALPVVGAHLVIVNLVNLVRARRRRQRRRVWVHGALALLTFAVVVGAWSAVLTGKYGHFTTGSTGKFNIAWNGPKFVTPVHAGSLVALPNDTGTSGWDDATTLDYPRWQPWASWEDRQHWEKNRTRNEKQIIAHLQKFSWLLWPILLLSVRLAGSRLDPRPRRPGAIVLAALLLYPLGYWLLHVYQRFVSLLCVGLLVLGVFAVCRLTWPLRGWLRVPLRVIGVVLVAWSFLSKPGWKPGHDPAAMSLGRWSIAGRWGDGDHHRRNADQLRWLMPPRSRVASNGNWGGTLNLAFLLDLRYYGELPGKISEAKVQEELAMHGVEYFWVWGDRRYRFLNAKPEISAGVVPGLQIYDLR